MKSQSGFRRRTILAATFALALAGAAAAANLDIVAAEQVAIDTTSNTGVGDAMGDGALARGGGAIDGNDRYGAVDRRHGGLIHANPSLEFRS